VTRIRVTADYDASPDTVWRVLEPLDDHVEWMADAETVRFLTAQTEGVGTRFECVTRIGPIRLVDEMEITQWDPGRAMGVRHRGVVSGEGRFTIEPLDDGRRSRFTWTEELRFPWWLGGPLGSAAAGPLVLRRIWAGNLRRLKPLVERAP
jgi:uncharacterized protein YndB with AHSA1/START domain